MVDSIHQDGREFGLGNPPDVGKCAHDGRRQQLTAFLAGRNSSVRSSKRYIKPISRSFSSPKSRVHPIFPLLAGPGRNSLLVNTF
jgi:hypothetical protein